VLKKVLEWCSQHKNDPAPTQDDDADSRKKTTDIEEWDQKFMQVDQEMLFEIILAANYMDIKALLDVGCKTVANMIKGKSPEEIRKTFNIQNDFTPEEPRERVGRGPLSATSCMLSVTRNAFAMAYFTSRARSGKLRLNSIWRG
jgi:hypothetical protein